MKLYILIIIDRHTDPEAFVYDEEQKAIDHAKKHVKKYGNEEDIEEGLNPMMIKSGWCYYCRYSCEGDYVYVQKRTLNSNLIET